MPVLKQCIPQEVCLACKGCCRFSSPDSAWSPRLLEDEMRYFLEHGVPPAVIAPDGMIRTECGVQDAFFCSLFDPAGNKCTVYAFRPLECRLYPFLINQRGGKVFVAVDTGCPFVQKNLASKKFKDYQRYVTEYLNTPACLRCIRENPRIIQSYADALDISELIL